MAQDISLPELYHVIKSNDIVVIDIRQADDIERDGGFPNAISVPTVHEVTEILSMTDEAFESTFNKRKPRVVSCVVFVDNFRGRIAEQAAKNAVALGYTKARIYRGGFNEWKDSGLEIDTICSNCGLHHDKEDSESANGKRDCKCAKSKKSVRDHGRGAAESGSKTVKPKQSEREQKSVRAKKSERKAQKRGEASEDDGVNKEENCITSMPIANAAKPPETNSFLEGLSDDEKWRYLWAREGAK